MTTKQEGGTHYLMPIQPIEYIRKNNLGWFEGNVIKYVSRHDKKNGAEDIKKAIHYLEMILDEYDELGTTDEADYHFNSIRGGGKGPSESQ